MAGQRKRGFCFTVNNYPENIYDHLRSVFEDLNVRYLVCQKEVAPSTGTPHVQGYLYCETMKTIVQIQDCFKKFNVRVAVIVAKGNPKQNRDYCTKEGGSDVLELGALPMQGVSKELSEIAFDVVSKRKKLSDVAIENPEMIVRFSKGLQTLYTMSLTGRDGSVQPEVHWWYGPTGTGKSRAAFEAYPDAYWKMSCNHWWDGYEGQTVVVVDDYRTTMCPFDYLLRMIDRYPLRVEVKGGTIPLNATTFVFTAPQRPERMWSLRTEEAINQLIRRITHVKCFQGDGSVVCLKNPEGVDYILEDIDRSAICNTFNPQGLIRR